MFNLQCENIWGFKMILSVSRRTDIPAFYSDWFYNRIREGYVCVRNPMNRRQVSKIRLSPDMIDCIAFWSKNPAPMLPRLGELADYMYYFQFTVTPYDRELEKGLPQKESVIETFRRLSDRIGPKRVIWRYDPILFSQSMDVSYHLHGFEAIAKRLASCTQTCVISFVDLYQKTRRNLRETTVREPSADEITRLASGMASIASSYGIRIQSCAERIDLEPMGIRHGRCIDRMLIEELQGARLNVARDRNQRPECGCVQSVDIGVYDTCSHGCLYCYANTDTKTVCRNRVLHDPSSPLLIGRMEEGDVVKERAVRSFKVSDALF